MVGLDKSGQKSHGGWQHPGWSWAAGRDWLVPGGVALATLLLGAALAGIPVVAAGNLDDPQIRAQTWTFAVLGAAGLATLAATAIIRHGRDALLHRNGTAYIVQEAGREWSHDDVRDFLGSAQRQFARIIRVPGPGDLGGSWDWPLTDGAQRWDAMVAELARAFQSLHSDDDPATPNGMFVWAWWAVTVALCERLVAADRGLSLDVWQRPTRGRAGQLTPAPWSQRPHRFGQGSQAPPLTAVLPRAAQEEVIWPARLTFTPREPRQGRERREPHARVRGRRSARARPVVLLIRLGRQAWGPVPDVPALPTSGRPIDVVVHDSAGLELGHGAVVVTQIRELRIVPPDGAARFPWDTFPSLVAAASAWIRRQAGGLEASAILLGTVMPAEIAAGLGIDAVRTADPDWPPHLWPLLYDNEHGSFTVPRLDLGAADFTSP